MPASRVSLFTAEVKEDLHPECGVLITTYHMVTFSGKRSVRGEELIKQVREREWGLMLLDEVHVVPAQMFRKVLSSCNAHCKLGLTATLVREDDLITDLNFLIGPEALRGELDGPDPCGAPGERPMRRSVVSHDSCVL